MREPYKDLLEETETEVQALRAKLKEAIEALERYECTEYSKKNVTVHEHCSCKALLKIRG